MLSLLESEYGIRAHECAPGPRGWTGTTWIVTTETGERVFVKVFPKERLPATARPALRALEQLNLSNISTPVPTTAGGLHAWLGDDMLVVYEYFDAPRVIGHATREVGELLARVHGSSVAVPLARERFEPFYTEEFWPTLEAGRGTPLIDQLLHLHEQTLRDEWAKLAKLAEQCQTAQLQFVITHGDWPFNVLVGKHREIYLVDWDELMLAPAERDLWFPHAGEELMEAYRSRRPEYVPNELARQYYVYARYFEDVFGSAQALLTGTLPEHVNTQMLFTEHWSDELRTELR